LARAFLYCVRFDRAFYGTLRLEFQFPLEPGDFQFVE
jgi:hypothetical protein